MQPSDVEQPDSDNGQTLAIIAESLYLINLLLFPGLAFGILLFIYFRKRNSAPPLARNHLCQTVRASIWAGVMIVVVNFLILLFGGYSSATTWIIVILYFTSIHASLVILGTLGLAKAMAGKEFYFPFLGAACRDMETTE